MIASPFLIHLCPKSVYKFGTAMNGDVVRVSSSRLPGRDAKEKSASLSDAPFRSVNRLFDCRASPLET